MGEKDASRKEAIKRFIENQRAEMAAHAALNAEADSISMLGALFHEALKVKKDDDEDEQDHQELA